jgi:MFS family permease
MPILPPQTGKDAKIVLAARAVRAFGDGLASLLLPVYLDRLGYDAASIGLIVTITLLGSAALVWGVGLLAHRLDLRLTLIAGALLTVGTGLGFAGFSDFWPLLIVAAIGTLTPTGGDISIFLPLEQTLLAGSVADKWRTALFARYSIVGTLASSCGALAIGAPSLLARWSGTDLTTALRLGFLFYAALGVACALLYRMLARTDRTAQLARPRIALGPSRGIVYKLAALFAVDSFGSGFFVQSMLALWLFDRFDLAATTAGQIFFWMGLASALSYLAASWLSARIGLINTMVFTHIPANLCLMALPFVNSLPLAIVLLLGRGALSQMDVPTRTSYVMAVVTPEERPAAASFTAVPRSLASALGPLLAGYMLSASSFGLPLLIGGAIKIGYDLGLLAMFRKVKPPEES